MSQVTVASSGDTPYIYMGGWGDLAGDGAFDAGLQYSPTFHNWALFEKGCGYGQTGPTNGDRFASNETISLSFAVVNSGTAGYVNLIVTATGLDAGNAGNNYTGNGQIITENVTLLVSTASYGWSAGTGNENTLKRMTSIAQSTQNFADGSSINGVDWTNAVLGQSSSDAVAWSGGGSQSYPNTPGIVTVDYVNAANETDNINLVPEPSSWAMLATSQVLVLGYHGWRRRRARRSTVTPST
jgi:hypothetical protein